MGENLALANPAAQRKHGWSVMKLFYPEHLPVSRKREDILAAMRTHQVVIVCGDTGSGKTTQLPKMALEIGGASKGRRIGCTQPRRIAATSVASRVAEEMEVSLGGEVGYQVRFDDKTSRDTAVKFMTDGILLAETQGDPQLKQYDTLIIDEAHERSLNIDFILGYLHRLLEKRRDLRVIISSATLDAEGFSRFFGDAPTLQVAGRTFPVEDRYQVPLHRHERLSDQVARAAEELAEDDPLGDTLVFLPGEREIRDAMDLLDGRKYPRTQVIALYARQASPEQKAAFRPDRSKRRIILATNVAETSLTLPDIHSVIDSGIVRMSRYDAGSGIQRLQIEETSQASARQRRGRCGRVREGICIRLYSEEDFEERDEFTDPEILRSNLAGVVLQMEHLRLGDPLRFPFIDPPPPKRVAQAYRVLEELGAIYRESQSTRLTDIGREMARLPVDPRVGRLLIACHDEGVIKEGLIVASALTVQDPRERPRDAQEAADSAHARFRDKRSDFTAWLRWWHAMEEARGKSNNQLRRFCEKNFLNYRRAQEWRNLHRELLEAVKSLRWKLPQDLRKLNDPEDSYSVELHKAILASVPTQIGLTDTRSKAYQGARGTEFHLFPGSGVFKARPSWVMAFEMMETAKLYARNAAEFDPSWFEAVNPHCCRYRYTNPHWSKDQGAVYGDESVIAFGLPVVEKRKVHYQRIDAKVARQIFIQEALVNRKTKGPLPILKPNQLTQLRAERLEHKLRRYNGLFHPPHIESFYEGVIPEDVCTLQQFQKWATSESVTAQAKEAGRHPIDFTLDDCLLEPIEGLQENLYPDEIVSPDQEAVFQLRYLHNPSEERDGITLRIPIDDLPSLPVWFGDWLVPGFLPEKVEAMLRTLPKAKRTKLPAQREVVAAFCAEWSGYVPQCSLSCALRDFLKDSYQVEVDEDEAFDEERIPRFLFQRFQIINEKGKTIASGRDLPGLQEELAERLQVRFEDLARTQFFQPALNRWDVGELPLELDLHRTIKGYPAVSVFHPGVDRESIGLFVFPSPEEAAFHHPLGCGALDRKLNPDVPDRLRGVLFTSRASQQKAGAGTGRARTRKASASPNLNSLANAFQQAGTGSVDEKKRAADAAKPAPGKGPIGFLTPEQAWLLDQVGEKPDKNRAYLELAILAQSVAAPRSLAEFEESVRQTEQRLFETAEKLSGALAEVLEIYGRLSPLLGRDDPAYSDTLIDSRMFMEELFREGWVLAEAPERFVRLQADLLGLEMRLTRAFGAAPGKDVEKIDRYDQQVETKVHAVPARNWLAAPPAVINYDRRVAESSWRLTCFAPELRARLRG